MLPHLRDKTVWVVGGVGKIGTGLSRAMLRAGATVIVNSRSADRLSTLTDELGHPERLIALNESMLPSEAETTVAHGMERAGGELHHVVSHAGVRWWDAATGDDGAMVNELAGRENRLLGVSPSVFAQAVSKSAELHFRPAAHCECSCRLFTPPLRTAARRTTWCRSWAPARATPS